MKSELSKSEVSRIRPDDLELFLISKGWSWDRGYKNPLIRLYHKHGEPEVAVPLDPTFGDYAIRVAGIIQMVARIENQYPWQILSYLATPSSDDFEMQFMSPNSKLGTIPLRSGVDLFKGIYGVLESSALSVHQPKAHYSNKGFADVTDFIGKCRLGQTRIGSYIATVHVPVPRLVEDNRLFPKEETFSEVNEPFARRVTIRAMRAIHTIHRGLSNEEDTKIFDSVDAGVSSNLCSSLAILRPKDEEGQISVKMSWSKSRSIVPEDVREPVNFTTSQLDVVKEYARILTEGKFENGRHVEGMVIASKAPDTTLLEGFRGSVEIKTVVNGKSLELRVELNRDDYLQAIKSHVEGGRVRIKGDIKYQASTGRGIISNASNLTLLPRLQ